MEKLDVFKKQEEKKNSQITIGGLLKVGDMFENTANAPSEPEPESEEDPYPEPNFEEAIEFNFIRHGQTVGNKKHILQGHSDGKLTRLGVTQVSQNS